MAVEIERKFLINNTETLQDILKTLVPKKIIQGYLSNNNDIILRARVISDGINEKGYLTIKGKQLGISKPEYEYEIPYSDAFELLAMSSHSLEKTRYELKIKDENIYWEIDVFHGLNEGLIIAEIELPSENYKVHLPDWIGKEVSKDFKYANNNLSINPYSHWK